MGFIPDNHVDIIITSPPYNLGVKYDSFEDWMEWDVYYDWCRVWLKECYRVLKPDGRLCLNHYLSCGTAKHRSAPLMNLNAICEFEIGFNHHGYAEWTESSTVKRTAWGSFLSASAPYISSPREGVDILYKARWKKDRKGVSTIDKKEFFEGTLGIWKMNPEKNRSGCPAPFPLALPMRCINLLSYKGDLVLDPFSGSATTAVAAKKTGRKYIGFELSKNYFDIGNKRLDETEEL
jgi:site-specific DNA-methyltransferase (adenine-specific)